MLVYQKKLLFCFNFRDILVYHKNQLLFQMNQKNSLALSVRSDYGFTLIELAISVAILSLLAVIITPTINDALIRARVASTQTNLCILRDGIELYAIDHNQYPPGSFDPPTSLLTNYDSRIALQPLLKRYIPNDTTLLEDYFSKHVLRKIKNNIQMDISNIPNYTGYSYFDYQHFLVPPRDPMKACSVISIGPDGKDSNLGLALLKPSVAKYALYSPTNGTISDGDLGISTSSYLSVLQ
jgi:prepilin-type N-terminal cleavage/methylation domain-containing protein